jgi:hypothetical protein
MLHAVRTHSETRKAWRHLRHLRRECFDAVVIFFTGDPSYWKIKFLPFLVGARHKLIINESGDCFFFSWRKWLALMAQRMGEHYRMGPEARWTQQSRFLLLCLLKLVVFPFRFAWLLIIWVWLRSRGGARRGRAGTPERNDD